MKLLHHQPRISLLRQLDQAWELRRTLGRERAAAIPLLGAGSPFVRVYEGLQVLLRQSLTVAAAIIAGAVALAGHAPWAPSVLIASAVVQLALAGGIGLLVLRQRVCARELIIEGREDLPIAAVARERDRLLGGRRRLAHAIDRLLHTADHWSTLLRTSRPVFNVSHVRAVATELGEIAALLRADSGGAGGVALVERLLTDGASPLYGEALDVLQEELQRIQDALHH
jgi:hypothetical protein